MVRAIDCPCGHQLLAATDEALLLRAKEHVAACSLNIKPSEEEMQSMLREKAYNLGDQERALVRRYVEEVWNAGKLDAIDELLTADYVNHDPMNPEVPPGAVGAKKLATLYREAFPDINLRLEDVICEGDFVVDRWTATGTHKGSLFGVAPTGKRVTVTGITINRIANGRIAESWINWDNLGLMQQLGAVPALARAAQ